MVDKIRKVRYAEVIGYWLDYEYRDRKDFKDHIDSNFTKKDVDLITRKHDFGDSHANARRYAMLRSYRHFIDWFLHAKWWYVHLDRNDISKLLVIHDKHWDHLSLGTLKAFDIAKTVEKKGRRRRRRRRRKEMFERVKIQDSPHIRSRIKIESDKIRNNLKRKVKSRKHSVIVVVGAKGGKDLTVIDGVHRTVRKCFYYLIKNKGKSKRISQRAYLGLTPDPVRHSAKEWAEVDDFFDLS